MNNPLDPELVKIAIRSNPDLYQATIWTNVLQVLVHEGKISFPIDDIDDLKPLVAAAKSEAHGLAFRLSGIVTFAELSKLVPAGAFPIVSIQDFLPKCAYTIESAHAAIFRARGGLVGKWGPIDPIPAGLQIADAALSGLADRVSLGDGLRTPVVRDIPTVGGPSGE